MKKFKTVDEYFSKQPRKIKIILEKIRKAIKEADPKAEEIISYNMPAFKHCGILIYFAAQKNHVGLYPTSSPIIKFRKDGPISVT